MSDDAKGASHKAPDGFDDCERLVEEGATLRGTRSGFTEHIPDARTRRILLRHHNRMAPILAHPALCQCARHAPSGAA